MEQKKRFIINVTFYALIGIVVFAMLKYVVPALTPFIIGFVIAAILQWPIRKFGKKSQKRKQVSAILCCMVFYILLALLLVALGIQLLHGAQSAFDYAPEIYSRNIEPVIIEFSEGLENAAYSINRGVGQEVEVIFLEVQQTVGAYLSDISVKLVKLFTEGITGFPGFVLNIVLMVISTFFIAIDFERIMDFFWRLLPLEKEKKVQEGLIYIKNIIGAYAKSYSLLFLLTFLELSIGLTILKMPYSILLALAISVFDVLPVLGTGGILLPWAVVLFFMEEPLSAVGILILYLVITIIRNILEPRIVGKQIGVHPLATLVAMILGLRLLGIIGMILFPVSLSVFISFKKNE